MCNVRNVCTVYVYVYVCTVYVYVYMYVLCMCMCICTYVCICVCMYCVCVCVCVYIYNYVCMYVLYMLCFCTVASPAVLSILQAAQALKQFADEEETFSYSETLMLEVDFETLIDDAESGVDEYMVFKDTMSG